MDPRLQDGWILAKFFFCVFMERDGVQVRKLAKKERGQIQPGVTEQSWSIKDLLGPIYTIRLCRMRLVYDRPTT